MINMDVRELLRANPYPGRGILLGRSGENRAVMAYFIMGRSENSRNRVFVEKDGGIEARAFDPALVEDPSLILYTPVRVAGKRTIVTNGDQTDTISSALAKGGSFEAALESRTFEPDAPHFTPRISGLLHVEKGEMRYALSILKSVGGKGESVQRFFFHYPQPVAGEGHLIHTYQGDGNPLPSFAGEPAAVSLEPDLNALAQGIWESLNEENKISLFVRAVDLATGGAQIRIFNKLGNRPGKEDRP